MPGGLSDRHPRIQIANESRGRANLAVYQTNVAEAAIESRLDLEYVPARMFTSHNGQKLTVLQRNTSQCHPAHDGLSVLFDMCVKTRPLGQLTVYGSMSSEPSAFSRH